MKIPTGPKKRYSTKSSFIQAKTPRNNSLAARVDALGAELTELQLVVKRTLDRAGGVKQDLTKIVRAQGKKVSATTKEVQGARYSVEVCAIPPTMSISLPTLKKLLKKEVFDSVTRKETVINERELELAVASRRISPDIIKKALVQTRKGFERFLLIDRNKPRKHPQAR